MRRVVVDEEARGDHPAEEEDPQQRRHAATHVAALLLPEGDDVVRVTRFHGEDFSARAAHQTGRGLVWKEEQGCGILFFLSVSFALFV